MFKKRFFFDFIFVIFCLVGVGLHVYRLNWGNPYFFHPDERNIAWAISQLRFPEKMNPQFFAYGGLPLYLIYFAGVLVNLLKGVDFFWQVNLETAILVGRFFSCFLFLLLTRSFSVFLNYFLGEIFPEVSLDHRCRSVRYAVLLLLFLPGMIQYSHFATFEMFLSFFYFVFFVYCLKIFLTGSFQDYLLAGLLMGLSLGTKVTSLFLPFFLFLVLILRFIFLFRRGLLVSKFDFWKRSLLAFGLSLLISVGVFLISNPFFLLDREAFFLWIEYEGRVAMGSLPIFYTAGFLQTVPLIYHFFHVFPYLLGFWTGLLSFLGMIFLAYSVMINRSEKKGFCLFLLFVFVCLLILSGGVLFVKWSRYLMPSLSFLVIVQVFFLLWLESKKTFCLHKSVRWLMFFSLLIQIFSGLWFSWRYVCPDSRILAGEWLERNLSAGEIILTENHDLGVLPLGKFTNQLHLFDFYSLDGSFFGDCFDQDNSFTDREVNRYFLSQALEEADYFVLLSRRVSEPRLRLPNCFPLGSSFYRKMLGGELGFSEVSWRDNPPSEFFLPDFLPEKFFFPEETYTVFDFPQVRIFQKNQNFSADDYVKLLSW